MTSQLNTNSILATPCTGSRKDVASGLKKIRTRCNETKLIQGGPIAAKMSRSCKVTLRGLGWQKRGRCAIISW